MKQVSVLVGAGSIGQAIIRRVSAGKHVVLADYSVENAKRTAKTMEDAGFECSTIQCDLGSKEDILKLVVVNRYQPTQPAVAFIKGFGLKRGALASSVAHDSHNIVSVGVTDKDILHAVNLLIEHRGGVTAYCSTEMVAVPLPVAGLMSNEDGYEVAQAYQNADALAKRLGSTLYAPFMTLAFMALLVIPELKISDRGLFDVKSFGVTSVYE